MVVGTPAAIQQLATDLQAALSETTQPQDKWPRKIAAADVVVGPYRDSGSYALSFHLEGNVASENAVPLNRSAPPAPVILVVLALALVGLLAVAWYVWAHVA
jgi:hypothetical protein